MVNIWTILGIISAVLLILYFHSRNAVWGGLTLGLIVGFVIAILPVFKGAGFNWLVVAKGGISGTLLGFVAELSGSVPNFIKKHKTK